MECPRCHSDTQVIDSRAADGAIRRRRACKQCEHRFTTYERIAELEPLVVKRDGRRESFQPEKLLRAIRLACVKRPIPQGSVEAVVEAVRQRALQSGQAEVASAQVGEWVLERLLPLDRIAAFRFASVFRRPGDLEALRRELAGVESPPRGEAAPTSQPTLPGIAGAGGSRRRVRRGG